MPRVAFATTEPRYNSVPPFHPDTHWPELPFTETSPEPNAPYRLLRDLLLKLGGDPANPLGQWIKPGQTVVLKPNFVVSANPRGELFALAAVDGTRDAVRRDRGQGVLRDREQPERELARRWQIGRAHV